jgi:hypothetical protein
VVSEWLVDSAGVLWELLMNNGWGQRASEILVYHFKGV